MRDSKTVQGGTQNLLETELDAIFIKGGVYHRLCEWCFTSIEGLHKNARFCSDECKHDWWDGYNIINGISRKAETVRELEARAETNEQKFAAVLANNPDIYSIICIEIINLDHFNIPESRWSANYFINWLRTYHRIHINNNCHGPFCDWFEREFGVTLNRRKTKLERIRQ